MPIDTENDPLVEKVWRTYMNTGKVPQGIDLAWFESKALRPIVRLLPDDPRCRVCMYPFEGVGGKLAKIAFGLEPSKMNPQLCNVCERFAEKYPGGAEVEVTLLFADVRGSTGIAEGMSPLEFSRLINRFFRAATKVLFRKYAMIEKLVGDEVAAFFVPGFAGEDHSNVAVKAGIEILKATGHEDPAGPWIPVGVGVHTGPAYVGSVSTEEGVADITVLGDSVNLAARLTSQAGAGQVILSETTRIEAGIEPEGMESRRLELKGKSEPVDAWVITVSP